MTDHAIGTQRALNAASYNFDLILASGQQEKKTGQNHSIGESSKHEHKYVELIQAENSQTNLMDVAKKKRDVRLFTSQVRDLQFDVTNQSVAFKMIQTYLKMLTA